MVKKLDSGLRQRMIQELHNRDPCCVTKMVLNTIFVDSEKLTLRDLADMRDLFGGNHIKLKMPGKYRTGGIVTEPKRISGNIIMGSPKRGESIFDECHGLPTHWTTAKKESTPIRAMMSTHIKNCLLMLEREPNFRKGKNYKEAFERELERRSETQMKEEKIMDVCNSKNPNSSDLYRGHVLEHGEESTEVVVESFAFLAKDIDKAHAILQCEGMKAINNDPDRAQLIQCVLARA